MLEGSEFDVMWGRNLRDSVKVTQRNVGIDINKQLGVAYALDVEGTAYTSGLDLFSRWLSGEWRGRRRRRRLEVAPRPVHGALELLEREEDQDRRWVETGPSGRHKACISTLFT